MRSHRSLLVLLLAVSLLSVGCAAPGSGEELESAQAIEMAPGTNASTPVVIEEDGVEPDDVSASTSEDGLVASLSGMSTVNGSVAGWLTVTADDGAQESETDVRLSFGGEERTVPVTVDEPDDPLEEGQIANITFSARTQGGELVLTNEESTADAPLPENAAFQEPQAFDPIPVQLAQGGQLPAELVDAVTGSDVGHSLSVDVPEIFGPEKVEETQPREEEIDRELSVPTEVEYPSQQAQQILPPDAEEGDEVDLPATQQGDRMPYTIVEMGDQQISFEFAGQQGDKMTLYEAWPDAAEVTNTSGEEATVRLTPDQQEGDTLTWNDHWGNVTEIASITNETIVLRHSPQVGHTYEQMNQRSQQMIATEIVDVTEEEIVIEQTNPHPLAGETLVFDVTITDSQDAPQPQTQQQPTR